MMTIEEEAALLFMFLSHPGGFHVNIGGSLSIGPLTEESPPDFWEVKWVEEENRISYASYKSFDSLKEASQYFVEKRRHLCLGLDFDQILKGNEL